MAPVSRQNGGAMFYGGIVDPFKPYSHKELMQDSVRLFYAYPDFLRVKTIGLSAGKRNIIRLTLGRGEKKILLCGAHHGREYISASFLMKLAQEYAVYDKNNMVTGGYNAARLLDDFSIDIVPMVNPDGVEICCRALRQAEQAGQIKNMQLIGKDYSEWKANARGVDLNRQYPCLWERLQTGVTEPASQGFPGNAPASEPEVRTMMRLCMDYEYILAASFHTKGEEIYYADSLTDQLLPQAFPIAQKLSALTGYAIHPVSEDPAQYAGGFENWFRMLFGRCAFLIELTPYNHTNIPYNDRHFEKLAWNKAYLSGLLLADEARLLIQP